ncbi:hypothetical protein B0J13DRAFT_584505 [Dactylonectria estremocensis]|uniref:NAD-dependent epimerase/dehydratase domain-containing protein n=1 Tax=Dactylonectria estremocensis TaxID=1079267 RepID=A0A9P9EXP2_9HYPO|nr:hypothetical protein B0J13DRAFT_584505 [Dactylonectria estremocensis]
MTVIAVAGGAGKLGRAIVEALVEQGQHDVVVLAREVNTIMIRNIKNKIVLIPAVPRPKIPKEPELWLWTTDTSRLAAVLETNKIETLIQAAEKSVSTKRYIPSFPIAQSKLDITAALEATSTLEYTAVLNGYFADYWVAPKVKSYQDPLLLVVDIPNNFAAIPGSGNELVAFTHTFDVARFVAALVGAPKWEKESYIIGDKVSWNQFVQYAEEAKGTKFTVKTDSVEELKKGQITELPSNPHLYPFFPKEMLQGLFSAFGRIFAEGAFDFKPKHTLNKDFFEVQARKVKDLIFEAWKE